MMEPEEVARFGRHIRAMGKAATDDPAAFAQMVGMLYLLQEELRQATSKLLDQGYSWSEIAAELHVKRSSAWERWRHRRP